MIPQVLSIATLLYRLAIKIKESAKSHARFYRSENRREACAGDVDHGLIFFIRRAQHHRTHRLRRVAAVLSLDFIDDLVTRLDTIIRRNEGTVVKPRSGTEKEQSRQLAAVREHCVNHGAIEFFLADAGLRGLHHGFDG